MQSQYTTGAAESTGPNGQLPTLTAALAYLARRWSVVPIRPGDKRPLVAWAGFQRRPATEEQVRAWWQEWPDAGVGIVTGAISGLVVLDVDGDVGEATLRDLQEEHDALPPTAEAITGGGGRHLLFAHPGGKKIPNKARFAAGLDTRADGGYIVAPPSVHPNGKPYAWEVSAHPEDIPPAALPPWLLAAIMEGKAKPAAPADGAGDWLAVALRGVGQGKRNDTCARLAGHYLRLRLSVSDTVTLLLDWNKRNRPPLAAGELRQIVASVDKTDRKAGQEPQAGAYHETDVGNAELLVDLSGEQLRFVHVRPRSGPVAGWWRVWDGKRWADDDGGTCARLAHDMARERLRRAADIPDARASEAAAKWALRSDSTDKIRDTLEATSWQKALVSRPGDYDTDPFLLNVGNGLLDLRTGDLRPHDPATMCHRFTPVMFDSRATAPRWERFLAEVFDGNDAMVGFVQRAAGYSLTGATPEDCLLLLHGGGTNGKSTLLRILHALLGDYALATDFATFTLQREKQGAIRNDLARLAGARLVTASETSEGLRFSEGILKQLTGGDQVAARFLHQEFFEFTMQAKIWLSCNHRPRVRDSSEAFWRRIRLLPFAVSFKGREEKHLDDVLLAELPGILTWALTGCLEWLDLDDLQAPPEVVVATTNYQQEEDTIGRFLGDCCEITPDDKSTTAALYSAYQGWSEDNGERPMGARTFGRELGDRGFSPCRIGAAQARGWQGVRLC